MSAKLAMRWALVIAAIIAGAGAVDAIQLLLRPVYPALWWMFP